MSDNNATPTMPAGLPEQYWDAQTGQVKMPELVKAYGEAAAFKADHDARLAALPAKPEDYKMEGKLPDGFLVPAGFEPRVDEKDPRIPALRELAHKQGWSQETVSALIGMDLQAQVAMQVEADKAIASEMAKL